MGTVLSLKRLSCQPILAALRSLQVNENARQGSDVSQNRSRAERLHSSFRLRQHAANKTPEGAGCQTRSHPLIFRSFPSQEALLAVGRGVKTTVTALLGPAKPRESL